MYLCCFPTEHRTRSRERSLPTGARPVVSVWCECAVASDQECRRPLVLLCSSKIWQEQELRKRRSTFEELKQILPHTVLGEKAFPRLAPVRAARALQAFAG